MSVYPLFLVLGSDGTIGAYADENILLIDLVQNSRAGAPARQVFKLNEYMMTMTYGPAPEYVEFLEPLENLCLVHLQEALSLPPTRVALCVACERLKKEGGRS